MGSINRPNVWITQNVERFDFSMLDEFGDINFITSHEIRPYTTIDQWGSIYSDLDQSCLKFNPLRDFVVLTGNPGMIALVMHKLIEVCADQNLTIINTLKWDSRNMAYQTVPIPFENPKRNRDVKISHK